MLARWLLLSGVCAFMLTAACFGVSAKVLHHLPSKAGTAAEEFAQVAFIENDTAAAYSLTADEFQAEFSQAQFGAAVRQMHTNGRPITVSAEEYESIPGQAAMHIFLVGQSDDEEFYYQMLMYGTSSKGYKVAGIFRSNGPPAESNRKPISE
jgi:membrane-bound lytic murein transglycosylase B